MRKHFILPLMICIAAVFVGCGEEVQMPGNPDGDEVVAQKNAVAAVFSTSSDGTRTSMNTGNKFFWEAGDQIWVNTATDTYLKTNSSTIATGKASATFTLAGTTLDKTKTYLVRYIGNGMGSATTSNAANLQVTIPTSQTQAVWGDASHLGASGDCGSATAAWNATTESFQFQLEHQAAYLVFQPYRPSPASDAICKLTKIEIIDNATGGTLAGTYLFANGTLGTGTATSNTVTLNCGSAGFEVTGTAVSAANSCFAVIQPGTHQLTIRYTIETTKRAGIMYIGSGENVADGETFSFTIDKAVQINGTEVTSYAANSVTTIRHELAPNANYYQWDALNTYGSATGAGQNSTISYPTDASQIAAQSAKQSCKDMPNANEMYWYVVNGDAHRDTTTPWSIDGGLTEYTEGLWLKKKATILAEGKTFSSTQGKDGVDMRITAKTHSVANSQAVLADSERSKYFFLPALGLYSGSERYSWRASGFYWSSSPYPGDPSYAYLLSFSSYTVYVGYGFRTEGFVVAPAWFK